MGLGMEQSLLDTDGPFSGSRSIKFKESSGYIAIQKENDCWHQCGAQKVGISKHLKIYEAEYEISIYFSYRVFQSVFQF